MRTRKMFFFSRKNTVTMSFGRRFEKNIVLQQIYCLNYDSCRNIVHLWLLWFGLQNTIAKLWLPW